MTQQRHHRAARAGAFAAVTAGALLLAGCSGSGSGGSSDSGKSEFSLSYAVSNAAVTSPYKKLAQAYMKENPNVTITFNEVPNDTYGQSLTTQLQAGNASDVFQAAPGTGQTYSILTLAKAGLLEPLGDEATKTIPSGSADQFQVDGKTYGVALGVTFVGTVLNETTAKTVDTKAPTTWDSLLSTCSSLESKGKSLYALAGAMPPNTGLMAMVISATRVYADDPKWNADRAAKKVTFASSQGWKDTLQAILDLKKAGCFQKGVEGGGFDAITNGLLQGTSLSAFVPSTSVSDLKQNAASTDFLVEPFPAASGGKAYGIGGADYAVSVNKASKHLDAAKKFEAWVATDAAQKIYATAAGTVPTSDLKDTPYAPVADIMSKGDYVPLPNSGWPNSAIYDALGSGVQGLLTGQKTVNDVLTAMDTAWDQ